MNTFTNSLNNKICLYDSIFILSHDYIVFNCDFDIRNNESTFTYSHGNELLFIETINLKIRILQEYRNISFFSEAQQRINIKNGFIIVSLNMIQLMVLLNKKTVKYVRNYKIYNPSISEPDINIKKTVINIDDIDKTIIEKETNKEEFIKLKNCLNECGYI